MESVINQVRERIKAQKHEGKVSFLSKNHKVMKIVFPSGETEEVIAGPRIRFGEFTVGQTVRVKAPDHLSAVWNKVEAEDEQKRERVKRKHASFDMDLLKSSKGLPVIAAKFPKIRFKGPGFESADLRKLMECYKDWASELYPKFSFHHIVRKLELMGSSKDVKVFMSESRLDYQVLKQDEAQKRELAQLAALNPSAPTEGGSSLEDVELDGAARQRMEENKQRALARLAQKRQEAMNASVDSNEDEDIDRAIADQNDIAAEDLG